MRGPFQDDPMVELLTGDDLRAHVDAAIKGRIYALEYAVARVGETCSEPSTTTSSPATTYRGSLSA